MIHKFDEPVRLLPSYSFTKNSAAFFLQQVALHVTAEDMQIVSFNPGQILTDAARNAGYDETSGIDWDDGMKTKSAVFLAASINVLTLRCFRKSPWSLCRLGRQSRGETLTRSVCLGALGH